MLRGVRIHRAGSEILVGSTPFAVAITPDGKTAYVTNRDSNSVTPIDTATNTAGTAIAVGSEPLGVAITPDGKTAYVTNTNSGSVMPIDTATNTASTAITVGSNPAAVAITPDQGPAAGFSATTAPAGQASSFDASASSDPDGRVSSYHWDFGDGASQTTTSATTTHTYATANAYTVTLPVTDDAACSTALVFTGQTPYCNASAAARSTRSITVPPPTVTVPPPTMTAPPPTVTVPAATISNLRVSPRRLSLARRKVNGKCVKPTSKNSSNRRCVRAIKLKVSYTLNRADTITFTLKRMAPRPQGQLEVRQADEQEQAQAEVREADRRPRAARQDRPRRR